MICAGPTGSGKTTTLYAALAEINQSESNVMTVEDPVEYVLPSINQIQIQDQVGHHRSPAASRRSCARTPT